MSQPLATLVGTRNSLDKVYPEPIRKEISEWVEWTGDPFLTREPNGEGIDPDAFIDPRTEYIFGTWGMPYLGESTLSKLPSLKGVFYAAGTVKSFVSDDLWERGIRVFSAAKANAVPVAEFTAAQIVLGLKNVHNMRITEGAKWKDKDPLRFRLHGNFRTRVGLVSYGVIARLVRHLLRQYDHEVWVYDPFLDAETAEKEGVRLADLDELFKECPVVSLHSPLLPETEGIIRGHHLASMAEDAVFINTARGGIVNEDEMVHALRQRPDLTAILDVLEDEPPSSNNPILKLPNAYVTPHIAGSMGRECVRMAAYILQAFKDYEAGIDSDLEVTKADLATMA